MLPDYNEGIGLVHCREECEDQEDTSVRAETSQRQRLLLKLFQDNPSSNKRSGERILRIIVVCFAIWGLIDTVVHVLPKAVKLLETKASRDCWCGETNKQAVAMGCQYDHLAVDWLPLSCTDRDLVEEFDMSGPGIGGTWLYYDAKNEGEKGSIVFDQINTTEIDQFALEGKEYFATREWHVMHCMFTWRKQFRARQNGKYIEPWNENEEHIKHCSDYVMRTLKWNLSLDVVDTQILGGDRHPTGREK